MFHRRHRARHKDNKKYFFKHCFAFDRSKKWSLDQLKETTLVFDGGEVFNPPLEAPLGTKWTCLRIESGDLFIADTIDPNVGVTFASKEGVLSPFIRIPPSKALEVGLVGELVLKREQQEHAE